MSPSGNGISVTIYSSLSDRSRIIKLMRLRAIPQQQDARLQFLEDLLFDRRLCVLHDKVEEGDLVISVKGFPHAVTSTDGVVCRRFHISSEPVSTYSK